MNKTQTVIKYIQENPEYEKHVLLEHLMGLWNCSKATANSHIYNATKKISYTEFSFEKNDDDSLFLNVEIFNDCSQPSYEFGDAYSGFSEIFVKSRSSEFGE